MTSETQKISFSGFIPYKVGQKSDIKEYFLKEFQLMASAPDDNYLSLDEDINRFLVQAGIELQISYSIIRDFTN